LNFKSLLKSLKLNESTISMILGAIVIVVVGVLVVNYFRDIDTPVEIPASITDESLNDSLPTTHVVQSGEDLWKISEKYYSTGYNWVDIAEANELSSPGNLEVGQELTIPDVENKSTGEELAMEESVSPTQTPVITEDTETTEEVVMESEPEKMEDVATTEDSTESVMESENAISGSTYTVVHGDSLWSIAQRTYGDGNKWVDIAKANDLVNPSIIHAGNVFELPAVN